MYLRSGRVDLIRQRCDKVRLKLIFDASFCNMAHIDIRRLYHIHKRSDIAIVLRQHLVHFLFHERNFHLTIRDKRIKNRHHQFRHQLCQKLSRLV